MTDKNRITIYGPKDDGTYVLEFRTAAGEVLATSIPRTEAAVIRHFRNAYLYFRRMVGQELLPRPTPSSLSTFSMVACQTSRFVLNVLYSERAPSLALLRTRCHRGCAERNAARKPHKHAIDSCSNF
jgi:hypothetical protein